MYNYCMQNGRDTMLVYAPIYFRSTKSMDTIQMQYFEKLIEMAAFIQNGRQLLV
jgi:hypothetical protein